MKISFWIPAVVFSVVRLTFSSTVQVGTVLFTTTDLVKKCWTENDKSLLKARLVMQDVLPDPDCIDFSNPNAVTVLLDYFHACFQIISTSTYGRIQNLMFLALSDALGGYLRAYVLPFTRRAYYAGEVRYAEAKKLFQLYDDIRVFLKTSGIGWVEPQKLCMRHLHVRPLVVTGGALEACKDLYIIEKEGKLHSMNVHPKVPEGESKNNKSEKYQKETSKAIPKRKREKGGEEEDNMSNSTRTCNGTDELLGCLAKEMELNDTTSGNFQEDSCTPEKPSDCSSLKRVVVPLPILDDCENPHSIAVPFKKRPFRNLASGDSAFILELYYLSVVKCFIAKGSTRADVANFNNEFHSWLISEVTPHLCEEQWYPGFGGVLRILQTIKKFGVEKSTKDSDLQDIAFLFSDGTKFDISDTSQKEGKTRVRDVATSSLESLSNERHVLTAIIVVSVFWLLIFCAVAFCLQATRAKGPRRDPDACRPSSERKPETEGRNVVFQFLIRFFGRRESECVREEPPPDVKAKPEKEKKCPGYFSKLTSLTYPTEIKEVKKARTRHQGQGDEVQMLWKKPSAPQAGRKLAPNDGHVTKKRYETTIGRNAVKHPRGGLETSSWTTSGCPEEMKQASTSSWRDTRTTNTYSTKGATSSTTMEFFEEVKARREKSTTECSTEETEEWSSTTVSEC